MKNIEQYYSDEITVMRGYIVNYINEREDLTSLDTFNLGQIYSFFNLYVSLLKGKKISSLNEIEQKELDSLNKIFEDFPDLIEYVCSKYESDLQEMKRLRPDEYSKYMRDLMSSRGFSIN